MSIPCSITLDSLVGKIPPKFSNKDIQKIVFSILEQSIRMMHPFIPFVTEEIWEKLQVQDGCLSLQNWPELKKELINKKAESDMQIIIELISAIRNVKVQWNISLKQDIECLLATKNKDQLLLLNKNEDMIKFLLRIKTCTIQAKHPSMKNSATGIVEHIKFTLPLAGVIDVQKEKNRILKQIEVQKKTSQGLQKRLKNNEFLKKAPPDIIAKEQERLDNIKKTIKGLKEIIKNLEV